MLQSLHCMGGHYFLRDLASGTKENIIFMLLFCLQGNILIDPKQETNEQQTIKTHEKKALLFCLSCFQKL